MKFKDSAFIFVTGFVLFVIGGFMNALGIAGSITYSLTRSMYSSSSSSGYVVLTLFGSGLALIGLIQMCMGAHRALKKIDALPVSSTVVEPPAVYQTQRGTAGGNDMTTAVDETPAPS